MNLKVIKPQGLVTAEGDLVRTFVDKFNSVSETASLTMMLLNGGVVTPPMIGPWTSSDGSGFIDSPNKVDHYWQGSHTRVAVANFVAYFEHLKTFLELDGVLVSEELDHSNPNYIYVTIDGELVTSSTLYDSQDQILVAVSSLNGIVRVGPRALTPKMLRPKLYSDSLIEGSRVSYDYTSANGFKITEYDIVYEGASLFSDNVIEAGWSVSTTFTYQLDAGTNELTVKSKTNTPQIKRVDMSSETTGYSGFNILYDISDQSLHVVPTSIHSQSAQEVIQKLVLQGYKSISGRKMMIPVAKVVWNCSDTTSQWIPDDSIFISSNDQDQYINKVIESALIWTTGL